MYVYKHKHAFYNNHFGNKPNNQDFQHYKLLPNHSMNFSSLLGARCNSLDFVNYMLTIMKVATLSNKSKDKLPALLLFLQYPLKKSRKKVPVYTQTKKSTPKTKTSKSCYGNIGGPCNYFGKSHLALWGLLGEKKKCTLVIFIHYYLVPDKVCSH